jgi:ABC-type histidine transport system ATPase subunit
VSQVCAYDAKVDGIYYNLDEDTHEATITYYNSYIKGSSMVYTPWCSGSLTLPEKITYEDEDYSVTSIGQFAFCNCKELTAIDIPGSIKSIESHSFYQCTALENVMIPAFIGGMGKKEARRRAEELLAFMGLSDRAEHKPNELSGGEKQRIAVARTLVYSPAVVMADEPSGSLDTQNKQELHQLFFDLRDRMGQTFVIVTHDEELARLTDRTIHMRDGQTEEN